MNDDTTGAHDAPDVADAADERDRARRLKELTQISPTRTFLIWLLSDKRRVRKMLGGFVGVSLALAIVPGIIYAAVWRLTYDPAEYAAAAADGAAATATVDPAVPTFGGLWPSLDDTDGDQGAAGMAGPDGDTIQQPSSLGPVSHGQPADPATAPGDDAAATTIPPPAAAPSAGQPTMGEPPAELSDATKQQITGTAQMFVSTLHDKAVTDYQAAAYIDAMATPAGINAASKVDRSKLDGAKPKSSKLTATTGDTATVTVTLENDQAVTVDLIPASEGFWLVDSFQMGR